MRTNDSTGHQKDEQAHCDNCLKSFDKIDGKSSLAIYFHMLNGDCR